MLTGRCYDRMQSHTSGNVPNSQGYFGLPARLCKVEFSR